MLQLDFFEKDNVQELKFEVEKVRKSSDSVRRGLFAKHATLQKMYSELHDRLEILEKNICSGIMKIQ